MTAEIEKRTVAGVPVTVALAVRRVYAECGGQDLASNLLTAAEAGDEHLRAYFEWDDTKAAHSWRLTQAENLVRRIKVTILRADDNEPIAVRAYVARRELPVEADDDPRSGTYVAIEDIAGRTDQEAAVVESIRRDIRRFQLKYRHFQDFMAVVAAELDLGP